MFKQKNRLSNILIRENDPDFCREQVTLGQGSQIPVGTVVGRRLFSVPEDGAAGAENTGGGALSGVSIGQLALYGIYTVTCAATSTGGGEFTVTTPEGVQLHRAVVGETYTSPHISFTLADGDPDFGVGDVFTIDVQPGDGKAFPLNPTATDGTQIPYGFAIDDYDASTSDVSGVVIKEKALIYASGLVWPDGITNEQKADALAALASRAILDREGV